MPESDRELIAARVGKRSAHPPPRRRVGSRGRYCGRVNPFFEDLGSRFSAAAGERGATIEAPTLDAAVAAELLDLARVAAHTQERRFAPLASFLAGVAAERLRAAGASADPETVAGMIHDVWRQLEAEASA